MPKCQIILDTEPNQKNFYMYAVPGEQEGKIISGRLRVLVSAKKDNSFKTYYEYIHITLRGQAHVYWTEPQGRSVAIYVGNEFLVNEVSEVWRRGVVNNDKRMITPGEYEFPFSFRLSNSQKFLSTFSHSPDNWIKYGIHVHIHKDKLLKPDKRLELSFPVKQEVNVNNINNGALMNSSVHLKTKTVCCLCCASEPIVMRVLMDRTGFCVGEAIPLVIVIENPSSRKITLTASLYKQYDYHASTKSRMLQVKMTQSLRSAEIGPHTAEFKWVISGGDNGNSKNSIQPPPATAQNPDDPSNEVKEVADPVVDESEVLIEQPKIQTAMDWDLSLRDCKIIEVSYYLNITARIKGSVNLNAKIPIVIGNVPPKK